MLATVYYPGPDGNAEHFETRVAEPAPALQRFTLPDGRRVEAELENLIDSNHGPVRAIYKTVETEN
jgi:hypothetical protein